CTLSRFRNARQRMPSSFGSKSQPRSENGSRLNVASIGFNHAGCARRLILERAAAGKSANRSDEFRIAAVLEKELQVLCVQAELPERPANLVGHRSWGRSPGPAVVPAGVFKP